jgi:hypothetical protein
MITPLSPQDSLTARGLYISKRADAIQVRIIDEKTSSQVLPAQAFKGGDKLRVEIQTNFSGHVYIVDLEVTNKETTKYLLFPNPDNSNNQLAADGTIKLQLTFDEQPAQEMLYVVASHDRLDFLEAALRNPNCSVAENRCKLDPSTAERVGRLLGDTAFSSIAKAGGIYPVRAEPQQESSVRVRGITLSPGKDKGDKSTYIAIPIGNGEDGRLKSDQIFAFKIALNHL